jgi:hypothetical protein
MLRPLISIFAFAMPFILMAESNSLVSFNELNYEAALARGKAENKLIFINYNSAEIDPCKIMDETTFSNLGVSDLLNDNFINVDADIDNPTGLQWISKFGVECMPTYMVLDNEGRLEGINQGTLTTGSFLTWMSKMPKVKTILDEARNKSIAVKPLDKSDNLLAIKRKLKEAQGNYVVTTTSDLPTEIIEEEVFTELVADDIVIENFEENTKTDDLSNKGNITSNSIITADLTKIPPPERVKIPYGENLKNTSITRTMSYSIQIGAFSDYQNAQNIMEESKEDFNDHYYILEEPNSKGKYLYKVIIGTYTSQEDAQVALKDLIAKGYNGFLRRI